jgi:hypothetical protein
MKRFPRIVLAAGFTLALALVSRAQTLSVTNGLTVQLKADGSLFKIDGTTPVSDGDEVGLWQNTGSAGSSGDASMYSPGFLPTFHANVLNGKPVVRFDGANDYLGSSSVLSLIGSSAWTTFAIFRATTLNNNNDVYGYNSQAIWMDAGGNLGMPVQALYGTPSVMAYTWAGAASPLQTISLGQFTFAVASHTSGLVSIQSAGAGSGSTGTVTSATGADAAGTGLRVGKGGQTLDGDLAELLMYNRTLTTLEMDSVTAYLDTKYDLGLIPIPEPTTVALLCGAGLALVGLRFRRARA